MLLTLPHAVSSRMHVCTQDVADLTSELADVRAANAAAQAANEDLASKAAALEVQAKAAAVGSGCVCLLCVCMPGIQWQFVAGAFGVSYTKCAGLPAVVGLRWSAYKWVHR
jgi:hypothetical protein